MPARNPQTQAKRARELAVREKRERKRAKKAERAAAAAEAAETGNGTTESEDGEEGEAAGVDTDATPAAAGADEAGTDEA